MTHLKKVFKYGSLETKKSILKIFGKSAFSKKTIDNIFIYRSSQLDTKKWLIEVFGKNFFSGETVGDAFEYSDLKTKKWFLEIFDKKAFLKETINSAFRRKDLETKKWLLKTFDKESFSKETINSAFRYKDLETKKWLLKTFGQDVFEKTTISDAFEYGNLGIKKWILEAFSKNILSEKTIKDGFMYEINHGDLKTSYLKDFAKKDYFDNSSFIDSMRYSIDYLDKRIGNLETKELILQTFFKDLMPHKEIDSIFIYADLNTKKLLLDTFGENYFSDKTVNKALESIEHLEFIQKIAYREDLQKTQKNIQKWFFKNFKDYWKKTCYNHFIKGNFDYARKIFDSTGIEFNFSPLHLIIDALENGINNSIEQNKYHAIVNLMASAGIHIPNNISNLHYSRLDIEVTEEQQFTIKALFPALALYYLGLNKNTSKAADEFDSLYQSAGTAMNALDNDFSLQTLTINGIPVHPLAQEVKVYRGIVAKNIDTADINSWFNYGIRAFSTGKHQKFLGYYANEYWNWCNKGWLEEKAAKWQFGGTYVSLDSYTAAQFAATSRNHVADGFLIEMHLPKGSPEICGAYKDEYELVPSTIEPQHIDAVHKMKPYYRCPETVNCKHQILETIVHNNYQSNLTYHVTNTDSVTGKNTYKTNLQCNNLPTIEPTALDIGGTPVSVPAKSAIYNSYNHFIETYTEHNHAKAQHSLAENFFSDRPVFYGECNATIAENICLEW